MDACEYCNRDDVTLYAWHADTWCADCIGDSHLAMSGSLEAAPLGRPARTTYEQPFVWQSLDLKVQRGVFV